MAHFLLGCLDKAGELQLPDLAERRADGPEHDGGQGEGGEGEGAAGEGEVLHPAHGAVQHRQGQSQQVAA